MTSFYIRLRGSVFGPFSEGQLKSGAANKAIADFTDAIRRSPDDFLAYYNRGVAYGEKGEQDKAIADYTAAIRIAADFALAYYKRGMAYRELGNDLKAAADFAKAKELGYEPPDEDE